MIVDFSLAIVVQNRTHGVESNLREVVSLLFLDHFNKTLQMI